MALATGTKLGPYQILSPLGAGGMGEVYRARDTRLDRSVAIKVLPAHLSSDPGLKQRLERESRAISALQHPNICTLFDVGSQDGVDFLVMELLDGETLAARLAKGPLPLAQAVTVGIEIAQALEKAHRQGIIHRDLKPANIMLTKSGAKLMDFGLAKPELAITGATGGLTPSTPTMSFASLTSAASPLTQKGSIVGTFQYLAPEVLQGEEADARSDIFAFGCVLYEMITGRRAFEGKSQISVLSAILEKEPDPIGASHPPMLNRIIRACLAKDPADRLQSAHDAAIDLRWIAESPKDARTSESATAFPQLKKSWLVLLAVAAVALAALAAFAGYSANPTIAVESLHAELPPPDKFTFDTTGDVGGMPVLSPQGDRVAFVAHSSDAKTLWVRPLNSDLAQQLEGTQGASHPFWSPDGRNLGYFANGKLMKIPAGGGAISPLADAPNGRGAAWGSDDVILYCANYLGPLMRVSAQGGSVAPATVLDTRKHSTHRFPWFLPDGKHFLFFATSHSGGDPKQNGVYMASVDNQESRFIVATDSAPEYASGYLLFRSGTALMAQRFDPESAKLLGAAHPLIDNIRYDAGVWRSIFSVSQNGLLVYQGGNTAAAGTRMAWFDRSGKELSTVNDRESTTIDLRISPDGKRVAYGGSLGIWTLDLIRKTKTRITFDQETLSQPSWSPDGSTLLFTASSRPGSTDVEIRSKASDGSGTEKTLATLSGGPAYLYPSLTPDGKYLTYVSSAGQKTTALWIIPVAEDAKGDAKPVAPVAIVQPPSPQYSLSIHRVSPDGHMVAYESDESGSSGNTDIYVTTFPEGKGKWRVSTVGAGYPTWRGNGKELFFRDANDIIYACTVKRNGEEIEVGTPQRLFRVYLPGVGFPYDVSPDGQRLLLNLAEEEGQTPVRLLTNWPEELKK
jgi:eukaryotic-like serine/threonine-protein kinase